MRSEPDFFHASIALPVALEIFSLISSVETSGLVIVIVALSVLVSDFFSLGLGDSSILILGNLGRRILKTYNK